MALATASEFRGVYPDLVAVGQDPVIDAAVAWADQLMATWCGLPALDAGAPSLSAGTLTLYPDPSYRHDRALDVGLRVVGSITSVHVDPLWEYGADTLVDSGDYLYDAREGLLHLKPAATGAWSSAHRANKVVLSHGWDDGSVPAAIRGVAIVQARYLLELPKLEGRENATTGFGSLTPAEVEALLAPGVMQALIPYIYWPSRVG